jgi:hypothetical protein
MDSDREESLPAFLARRERELTHQLAALRFQIESKEFELGHVREASKRLPKPTTRLSKVTAESDGSDLSIKELVVRALFERFLVGGATPAQLREYFRDAYGRTIERSSLSPQLSRLKAEGRVMQDDGDIWRVTAAGALRSSASKQDSNPGEK